MAKIVQSVCNYCGVGCSVEYHIAEDGSIAQVKGAQYPVNRGIVCPKGFKIHEPILSDSRGTTPLVRRNGKFEEASWEEAITLFTDKVKDLQAKHGKKSVAFISTGQMYTEEMALLGQVARTGMGIDGDGNTRQCMASAVVGYKQAFGFDSPPMTYKDMELSDCIVLVGSNMPIAHPLVWHRLKSNTNEERDLIVIDPRQTEAAKKATMHIPIYPKRDIIFLYMAIHELIRNNWIDKNYVDAHTVGFEDLKAVVEKYDPNDVEKLTGIPKATFDSFVQKIHTRKRVTIWWTMGVNQSNQGTRTVQAIINLCLLTGNIGRPGAGPCSLTGQANAMGSRLFSNTTALFGGGDYGNEDRRKKLGNILNIDPARFPDAPTKPYDKIIEGVGSGDIKGMWIVCTNPLHSWIDAGKIRKQFRNLELLVVQDLYSDTVTGQHADIYLPAAGAGEKYGFLINSERRLGAAQIAKAPPGDALPDFDIFKLVAKYYGCEDVIKGWDTPKEVFNLLRSCSEGMPCDFTGIRDYEHLLEKGGIQWPYPKGNPDEETERRLFEDGNFYHPDKKAKLLASEFAEPGDEPNKEFPIYLITGRGSIMQFQSNTRTIQSPTLRKQMQEELYAEVNETDALSAGVNDGEKLRITSKTGSIVVNTKISTTVQQGMIFLPFHYPDTNLLIADEFDAYSRQPALKTGAVKIEVV